MNFCYHVQLLDIWLFLEDLVAFAAITALLKAQDHGYIIFIMYNYWIFGYIFAFFLDVCEII
ncbi:unnamed protein product, partial [Vitis vinifera]